MPLALFFLTNPFLHSHNKLQAIGENRLKLTEFFAVILSCIVAAGTENSISSPLGSVVEGIIMHAIQKASLGIIYLS